jgi:NADH dehydrogenase [ubiquinone] 1 alpha subcomplex assembly factor 7
MTPLEREIRGIIRRRGPIPVADYMALALGHPEHGYYRQGDPLGRAGDFITAPEISQVFGELVGLWCATTWRRIGAPDPVRLVELGPGRGTLMADALRAAGMVPGFLAAADIHLVETSPALTACQQDALAGRNVTWHKDFADVPAGPLVLVANEFFDALPVQQWVRTGTGWRRRCVGVDGADGGLRFVLSPRAEDGALEIPKPVRGAPTGAVFEVCAEGLALAGAIGARLAGQGGAALIIDYGPAESAAGCSLQAVRNHAYHPVLSDPGHADLTAHVDFAALAHAARHAGAQSFGPVAQGDFLTGLGIAARMERLAGGAAPDQARAILAGGRRLIDADAMGTLFKVLALAAPALPAPAGFEP